MESSLTVELLLQIVQNLLVVAALVTALKIRKTWSDARDTTNDEASRVFLEQMLKWFCQVAGFGLAGGLIATLATGSLLPLTVMFALAVVWVIFFTRAARLRRGSRIGDQGNRTMDRMLLDHKLDELRKLGVPEKDLKEMKLLGGRIRKAALIPTAGAAPSRVARDRRALRFRR